MFNQFSFFRPFDSFNDSIFDEISRPVSNAFSDVDIFEDDTTVRLKIDVPGMKKEDLKVELREGLLMIKASRKDNTEGLRTRGRREINFSKSFNLDDDLDQNKIDATCVDGVLEVILNKKPINLRSIEIK